MKVAGLQNLAAQLSQMSRDWHDHGLRHARLGRQAAAQRCYREAERLAGMAAKVYSDARVKYEIRRVFYRPWRRVDHELYRSVADT